VTQIRQPEAGETAYVRVAGADEAVDIACRRIIWTGRSEDLATAVGAPGLGAALTTASRRRDLAVVVVRIHSIPPSWNGFQCIYTSDRGVVAQRFQNYSEWNGLRLPPGLIGLEYSVTSGDSTAIASTVGDDLAILGVRDFEILGVDILRDAYSNFDSTRPLLRDLEGILQAATVPIMSTGRQGAGIYINMDQALQLGERAAAMRDYRGVLDNSDNSVYTKYQETADH